MTRINISGNLQQGESVKYNVPLKLTEKAGTKSTYTFLFGNTSNTLSKKTKVTKKGHLFPMTSDSTSVVSLIVLCVSLTALGAVVYKRKRL